MQHRRLVEKISNIIIASMNAIEENSAVTFDGKSYPDNGWVIFTCGGPGSGKSWVIKQQLLIDAKILDSDDIKMFYIKWLRSKILDPTLNPKLKAKLLGPFRGKIPNPKNPKDMEMLHAYTSWKKHFFTHAMNNFMASASKNMQNLIIDTTGNNVEEILYTIKKFKKLGYKTAVVWVITNVNVAKDRNYNRPRVVDNEYLEGVHKKIAKVIPEAITSGTLNIVDDFWVVFNNQSRVDNQTNFRSRFMDTAYRLTKKDGQFQLDENMLKKIVNNIGL